MPLNGFLGPSSGLAVLTRILRHPSHFLILEVVVYYYSIYFNMDKAIMHIVLSLFEPVLIVKHEY